MQGSPWHGSPACIEHSKIGEPDFGVREHRPVRLDQDGCKFVRMDRARVAEVALLNAGGERRRREDGDELHAISPSLRIRW